MTYELDAYATLTSADYLERLNNPTLWSVKMMPHHRNMVRSQCRMIESYGGGITGSLVTVRLSPETSQADAMRSELQHMLSKIPHQAGLTSGHLLQTQTPKAALTEEQKIRGGADAVADWIVLVCGYDARALEDFSSGAMTSASLGVGQVRLDCFRLAYAATPADF